MPASKTFNGHIPDARYRCEGVDLGTEQLAEIHFRDPDGGYYPPSELYFVRIVDRKNDLECHSFFCESCIKAYKLSPVGKTTLKEAINSKFEEAQRKAAHSLRSACGAA